MVNISPTAIIHSNVHLGINVTIEDHCIIGLPLKGLEGKKTFIGDESLIRAGTYIYAGNSIGKNFQTGNKVNIRELNKIGDYVSIGTGSVLEHHINIGNRVRIHSQVFVPEFSQLDDDCWLGPNVVLTNARYPKHPLTKKELDGVKVGKNAKIGANSTVLPGILIGDNSLVGAGSVVTKNVEKDAIVIGNPAKFIKKIEY